MMTISLGLAGTVGSCWLELPPGAEPRNFVVILDAGLEGLLHPPTFLRRG